jgi:8-oxo-dGTP pyrophosphatase MutT (NUDIX family)
MPMKKYVLGFLFNDDLSKVVLIRKNRPTWMRGLLNGVGGELHRAKNEFESMYLEFKEEAGVSIIPDDWFKFCEMSGPDWIVHCFVSGSSHQVDSVRTKTDEQIVVVDSKTFSGYQTIEDLAWLVPLAKNFLCTQSPAAIKTVKVEYNR